INNFSYPTEKFSYLFENQNILNTLFFSEEFTFEHLAVQTLSLFSYNKQNRYKLLSELILKLIPDTSDRLYMVFPKFLSELLDMRINISISYYNIVSPDFCQNIVSSEYFTRF